MTFKFKNSSTGSSRRSAGRVGSSTQMDRQQRKHALKTSLLFSEQHFGAGGRPQTFGLDELLIIIITVIKIIIIIICRV